LFCSSKAQSNPNGVKMIEVQDATHASSMSHGFISLLPAAQSCPTLRIIPRDPA
jgi:hypothetical protein